MSDKKPRQLPIVTAAPDKELMPEVLPDPTRGPGGGSARQRTVERMTRLVAMAAASATIQAQCADSSSGPGYGVVDPMPAPSRCLGVAQTIHATARWKKVDAGLVIEVTLPKPQRADARYATSDPVRAGAGTILRSTPKDGASSSTPAPTPRARCTSTWPSSAPGARPTSRRT